MELKDTLLMPKTNFPMRGNLGVKEEEFQKKWKEINLYQKVLLKNKDKTTFILHDGPPYANGNIHVGHALQKILKDFVLRYKTMSGFYVPFIPGWDTHGLPIENEIVKKGVKRNLLSRKDFREKCQEFALKQVEKQKEQFMRLGILGDWENPYLTLDKEFVADQIEVFAKMVKKNLIYRGLKPVYWSPSSESAFAEAEIEYKDKNSTSIYVTFKIVENKSLNGVNLLIWTTTPWSLPGNMAICVNPKIEYILISVKQEKYIISKNLLNQISEKLGWKDVKIIKEISGKKLENIKYKHPLYDRISPVILGEHVTETDGTGLVHTAPGHGEDDYKVSITYKLDILSPVDSKGYMNIDAGKYSGLFYEDASKKIVEDLKEFGNLLKEDVINHSYPHDWRTGKPIIYRATPQWFASIEPLKNKILEAIKNVNWTPKWGSTRLSNMIANRSDWVISRQRTWGVPIPVFYLENDLPLLDYDVIMHVANLIRVHGPNIWYELSEVNLLPKGYKHEMSPNGIFKKELDIMDVWFDSGSSYNILKARNLPFPADLYLEGSDQYRGWFNSSLITSIAVNGISPYKNVLSHGFVLDGKGYKMSKSVGNTIDPLKILKTHGADILRLWAASTAYQSDVRISDELINQTAEAYRKIRNTFRFILGNLNDFNVDEDYIAYSMRGKLNRAITLKYFEVINECLTAYENFEFDKVYRTIMPFITNYLSAFYLDFAKDVLYVDEVNNFSRRAIQSTLHDILTGILKILTPIIPHTTSECYWNLKSAKNEDIYLEDMPEKMEFKDEVLMNNFKIFENIREKVLKELELARAEKIIGKSLESKITLFLKKEEIDVIKYLELDLEIVLISSNVEIKQSDEFKVIIEKFEGEVCARCWRTYKKLNENHLCDRCQKVVEGLK